VKLNGLGTAPWQARLRRLERPPTDLAILAGLGVLMPSVAAMQPVQPIRALAAASVLMILPGLAVARLLRLADPVLLVLVSVAGSLALTVLTSTSLMYAGIWSWQLALVLLGAITVVVAAVAWLADAPT
jgi:hypothetical protein